MAAVSVIFDSYDKLRGLWSDFRGITNTRLIRNCARQAERCSCRRCALTTHQAVWCGERRKIGSDYFRKWVFERPPVDGCCTLKPAVGTAIF
jgi:hypothetical protein